MLNKIIDNELNEFMQDKSRQNDKDFLKVDNAMFQLLNDIKDGNKELSVKFDEVTSWYESAVGAMYFREGFSVAIRLINEIYGGVKDGIY